VPERRRLEIHADLDCEFRGEAFQIRTDPAGQTVVTLPSTKLVWFAVRRSLVSRSFRRLIRLFTEQQVPLVVQTSGTTLVTVGEKKSHFAAWMGFKATALHLKPLIAASFQRRG